MRSINRAAYVETEHNPEAHMTDALKRLAERLKYAKGLDLVVESAELAALLALAAEAMAWRRAPHQLKTCHDHDGWGEVRAARAHSDALLSALNERSTP